MLESGEVALQTDELICRVCMDETNDMVTSACACKGSVGGICYNCMLLSTHNDPESPWWIQCSICKSQFSSSAMKRLSRDRLVCIQQSDNVQCRTRYFAMLSYAKTNSIDEALISTNIGVCEPHCIMWQCLRVETYAAVIYAAIKTNNSWHPTLQKLKDVLICMNGTKPSIAAARAYETGAKVLVHLSKYGSNSAAVGTGFQEISVGMMLSLFGPNSLPHFRARLVLKRILLVAKVPFCSKNLVSDLLSCLGPMHPYTKLAVSLQ